MSTITTHVLDTSRGRPARGVAVTLERQESDGRFTLVNRTVTNADGRAPQLAGEQPLGAGVYRITFDTDAYFRALNTAAFYPSVSVLFRVTAADEHHHVPLLLSPFGYSTYRGS